MKLQLFWEQNKCAILQPYDIEVGAGTFHVSTFLQAVTPEYWRAAYVQGSRRPKDGRYGDSPNRLQHYYQFQVVLKPSPDDIQALFLKSLEFLGLNLCDHDIRFVEDNWESPTLGAWGLGWEIWLDGMEVSQFTYFQEAGSLSCMPVTGELTYGLERLAMYLQKKDDVFSVIWAKTLHHDLLYGDLFRQNEYEQSSYNFEHANAEYLFATFLACEKESQRLIEDCQLSLPAYEMALKCSHIFNLLDSRRMISVTERVSYIGRIRVLTKACAITYYNTRFKMGFPLAPLEDPLLVKLLGTDMIDRIKTCRSNS